VTLRHDRSPPAFGHNGLHYQCASCDFEFYSGHSHHEGACRAICIACLTEFKLPTRSTWGPELGEIIEIMRLVRVPNRRKLQRKYGKFRLVFEPTGQQVIVDRQQGQALKYEYLSELPCNSCGVLGTYALDLSNVDMCPKCKSGELSCKAVMY